MNQPQPSKKERSRSTRRSLLEFLFAFCCVFAGLALPSPGIGPLYVRTHVAIGNAIVQDTELVSGVRLTLSSTREELAKDPWHATLRILPKGNAPPVLVPIDFRGLMFLPTVAFVGLALAAPMGSARRNLILLVSGLPLLELLLMVLTSVPLLSFLGGTGPIRAFDLGVGTHVVLQIVYRALVAPPGMAFALPLFLWWFLVNRLGGLRGWGDAGSKPTDSTGAPQTAQP